MRTRHFTIVCCVSALAVAPAALTHCGSSSSASPKSDAGKGSSSGATSGGSGGGTSSSGSSSGFTGDDGNEETGSSSSSGGTGDDGSTPIGEGGASSGGEGGGSSSGTAAIPVPEGGAPSDPGEVACGSMSCSTSTSYCCTGADGGTCEPYNSGSCGTVKETCNEATDCTTGVCCQLLELGPHDTSCKTVCAAGDFQVCRTNAECGSADAGAASQQCIVQTCPIDTMGGMATAEACAYYTAPSPANAFMGHWGALVGCTAQ